MFDPTNDNLMSHLNACDKPIMIASMHEEMTRQLMRTSKITLSTGRSADRNRGAGNLRHSKALEASTNSCDSQKQGTNTFETIWTYDLVSRVEKSDLGSCTFVSFQAFVVLNFLTNFETNQSYVFICHLSLQERVNHADPSYVLCHAQTNVYHSNFKSDTTNAAL